MSEGIGGFGGANRETVTVQCGRCLFHLELDKQYAGRFSYVACGDGVACLARQMANRLRAAPAATSIVIACEWHPINPPQFSLRVWLHGSQFHCGFLVASEADCRTMAELLVPDGETKEDEDGFSRSTGNNSRTTLSIQT